MTHQEQEGFSTTVLAQPDLMSVLWARFVEPFSAATYPFAVVIDVEDFGEIDDLVPTNARVQSVRGEDAHCFLIETPDWIATLTKRRHRAGQIVVCASTEAASNAVIERFRARLPTPVVEESRVSMDFWQLGQEMYTTSRSIDVPTWADIAGHYPSEVGLGIVDLMSTKLVDGIGRVILWHGVPGTGKTTAIRSLAGAWRHQARFQIVLDPERVFSMSSHMMSVLLGDGGDTDSWRVLVIEDADELVASDSGDSHVLSRLLNIGDGIVGQGLKVLVMLTTNKAPSQLHPALSRPGRCLSQTEFRAFSRSEATASFGGAIPDGASLTLAQIMNKPVSESRPVATGLYL